MEKITKTALFVYGPLDALIGDMLVEEIPSTLYFVRKHGKFEYDERAVCKPPAKGLAISYRFRRRVNNDCIYDFDGYVSNGKH